MVIVVVVVVVVVVDNICGGVGGVMNGRNVNVIYGTASLTSTTTATVKLNSGEEQSIEFDKAIIATGSVVSTIPVKGIDSKCVVISDDALAFKTPPKSMAIVGGGVIGSEFAALYSRLGTKVTVIEAKDTILPYMDKEMASLAKEKLEKDGISFNLNASVTEISDTASGGIIKFTKDGIAEELEVEKVLMAVGRKPLVDGFGLESVEGRERELDRREDK